MTDHREKALDFYGTTCQVCREDFDSGEIEVHHADGDRTNGSIWNLKPLCKSCHSKIHKDNGPDELVERKEYTTIEASIPTDLHEKWKEPLSQTETLSDGIEMLLRSVGVSDCDGSYHFTRADVDVEIMSDAFDGVFSEENVEVKVLEDKKSRKTAVLLQQ